MTTTRATLSNEVEEPKHDQKEGQLIDTTETTAKEKSEQDSKTIDDKSKQTKLDKEELLKRAKEKVQEAPEELINDGMVPLYIPYPGTGLPVEKREINGKTTHALEVTLNGKKHLIPANKQVRVPKDIKEAVENTTHLGMKADTDQPVIFDK